MLLSGAGRVHYVWHGAELRHAAPAGGGARRPAAGGGPRLGECQPAPKNNGPPASPAQPSPAQPSAGRQPFELHDCSDWWGQLAAREEQSHARPNNHAHCAACMFQHGLVRGSVVYRRAPPSGAAGSGAQSTAQRSATSSTVLLSPLPCTAPPRQIHSRGGANTITSWGKFWLAVLVRSVHIFTRITVINFYHLTCHQ